MKKFVPDLPSVVHAEKVFIGILGQTQAAPGCYKELARQLTDLAKARDGETDEAHLRALSAARWGAIMAVRAYGPSGDAAIDSAFGRMEAAAEEAGAAKRSRR